MFHFRLLYEYAEAHKGKVDVVYLLAGWTKVRTPFSNLDYGLVHLSPDS
jgi:hypothetical protein